MSEDGEDPAPIATRTLQELVQLLPIPVHVLDADGRVTSWNPAAETTFGWTAAEVIGHPYPLARHDPPEHAALVAQAMEAGRTIRGRESRRMRKDGTPIDIELWTAPIRDASGVVVASIGVTIDIEARRAAEQDYRRLFDGARDAIVLFDPDTEIVLEANPCACAMYGVPHDQLVGTSLLDRTVDVDRGRQAIETTLEAGQVLNFETVQRRADGSLLYLECSATPAEYRGRRAIMTIIRDVTDRRRLQSELQHAQKLEVVGQLAGGVAHDFNNLLTAFLGVAEELRREDAPDLLSLAGELERAGERGRALTTRLLAFSRRQELAPEDVELDVLVAQMGSWLRRLVPGDVQLTMEHRGISRPWVHVDRLAMEQVIANLVVNARDAMPEGGRLELITAATTASGAETADAHPLSVPTSGDWATLTVRDTGVGMSPEVLDNAFTPFFTTKGPRGTGLGLSALYGTVQQAGGRVTVASEPGVGTTFVLYLPMLTPREPTPPPAPRVQAPAGVGRVLLVEDDPLVRRSVARTLRSAGYEVIVTDSVAAAWDALDAGPDPDIVLSDVRMPGASGYELARDLTERRPELPVLLMSGHVADERRGRTAVPLLSKPFSVPELLEAIRSLL